MAEPKVPDRSRPPVRGAQVVRPAEAKPARPSLWVRFLRALMRALGVPAARKIPRQRRPRHTSADAPNRGCQGRRSIEGYRAPSWADTGSNRRGSGGCNNLRTKAS
jgi:hypothetical protein